MTRSALAPDPVPDGVSPQSVADAITRAAGSSFSIGMTFMSPSRRAAIKAVYAFCRTVDDIADGSLPVEQKTALLDAWRSEVDALYNGAPRSAIGLALLPQVRRFDLPRAEFDNMIDGMERDVAGPLVCRTDADLISYCRQVAGSVGVLGMYIFGAWRGQVSHDFAQSTARALQITNILRDIEEDARDGRIYAPLDLLNRLSIPANPAALASHPNLPQLRAALGANAKQHFAAARALIGAHRRSAIAPALAMYGVYRGYLDAIEKSGWQPLDRTAQSKFQRMRHALGAVIRPW